MLGERAGKLERKREPHNPYLWLRRAPSFKPVEGQGFGPPVTARRSMSKGCPRLPRRDTTERNKAELSPWTLSGAASALAGCPRTARHRATRNAGAKALRAGQCDESASCRAAGAVVTLAPLSARTRLVLETNEQRGARLEVLPPRAHYPNRRAVTSAGLALRRVWRVRGID